MLLHSLLTTSDVELPHCVVTLHWWLTPLLRNTDPGPPLPLDRYATPRLPEPVLPHGPVLPQLVSQLFPDTHAKPQMQLKLLSVPQEPPTLPSEREKPVPLLDTEYLYCQLVERPLQIRQNPDEAVCCDAPLADALTLGSCSSCRAAPLRTSPCHARMPARGTWHTALGWCEQGSELAPACAAHRTWAQHPHAVAAPTPLSRRRASPRT